MANKRTDLATVQCRVHRSMSFARHLLHGFLYWKLFLQGIRGRGSTGNGAGEVCFLRGRFLGPQIRYTSEGGWEGGWDSRRGVRELVWGPVLVRGEPAPVPGLTWVYIALGWGPASVLGRYAPSPHEEVGGLSLEFRVSVKQAPALRTRLWSGRWSLARALSFCCDMSPLTARPSNRSSLGRMDFHKALPGQGFSELQESNPANPSQRRKQRMSQLLMKSSTATVLCRN